MGAVIEIEKKNRLILETKTLKATGGAYNEKSRIYYLGHYIEHYAGSAM